jgi:hypothetical protein
MIKTIGSIVVLVGLPTVLLATAALAAQSVDQPRSSISELLNKNWRSDILSSLGSTEADSAAIRATPLSFTHGIPIGTENDAAAPLAKIRAFSVDQARSSASELLNTDWSSDVRSSLGPIKADSATIHRMLSSFTRDIPTGTENDAAAPLEKIRTFSVDQSRSSASELLNTSWSSEIRSLIGRDHEMPNDTRAPNGDVADPSGSFDREHN